MENLSQEAQIGIVIGAFFLGWLITWLVGRSRRKRDAKEYQSSLQTAQSGLKRTQDDLETVQSQLGAQRARAEDLAADKANIQSKLEQIEEASAGTDEKTSGLEEALGQELQRREAAEEMLEQVRAQAMELQTALDASQAELAEMGVRVNGEAEARAAAETALEAEALRVGELAEELEAEAEMEQAAVRTGLADVKPVVDTDEDETGQLAELEENRERIAEMSESVNALSAMGAELSLELEKREQENKRLRAQLAALEPEPAAAAEGLADEETFDREAELVALRDELSAALTQNKKLEQQLAAAHAEVEESLNSLDSAQQAAEQSVMDQAAQTETLSADATAVAEAVRQKEAALSEATARMGELEAELTARQQALAGAEQQVESLASKLEMLQNERDSLSRDKTGMEARLQDRTEEVNALTSATVTAAATIKRRDEALQRAGAEAETLRAQIAEMGSAKAEAEAALAGKDTSISEAQAAAESLRAELDALAETKTSTDAALAEKDAAIAEGQAAAETLQSQLQELRAENETAQAQLASRNERLKRLTALVQTVTAGEAGISRSPAKTAAVRSALALGVTPGELLRPQNFNPLTGIGAAYEQRLYAAGVGTYWELANIPDEDLLQALGLESVQQLRVEPGAIRAEAYKLAEETGTVGLIWEGRQVDDFGPLAGVGEVYEQRLYAAGIHTMEALAGTTVERLTELIETTPQTAPDFASWIEQAKTQVRRRVSSGA